MPFTLFSRGLLLLQISPRHTCPMNSLLPRHTATVIYLRHLPTLTSYLHEIRDQRCCRGGLLRRLPKRDSPCDGAFTMKEIVGTQILFLSSSSILMSGQTLVSFSDLHIINNSIEVRASVRSDQTATVITIASLPVADADGNPQDNDLNFDIEETPWPARGV